MACILLTNNNLFSMQGDGDDKRMERVSGIEEAIPVVEEDVEDIDFAPIAVCFIALKRGEEDVSVALENMRKKILNFQKSNPAVGIIVYLGFCDLQVIRDSFFEGMTNVIELDISNNQLTQEVVKQICCNLTNLRDLDLGGNQLTDLPVEIENLTKLRALGLNDNELTQEAIQHVCRLTKLNTLGLFLNYLEQLPAEIVNLTDLQVLNLAGNRLSQMAIHHVYQLENLHSLDLSGNPSTIEMHELVRWLRTRGVVVRI